MILCQTAHGPHAALLRSSAPIHERLARHWKFQYVWEALDKPDPSAHWRKIDFILAAMEQAREGETVLWLDSDAFVIWPWANLDAVLLPGYHLAAHQRLDAWYNTGVLFLRKSPKVLEYLKRSLEGERLGDAGLPQAHLQRMGLRTWFEQEWLNAMLPECRMNVQALNRDYNECESSCGPSAHRPIIRGWHGERFVCKARGLQAFLPKASFLLELKEHGVPEAEAYKLAGRG